MTVLTLAGKPVNWSNPPKATDKVLWSQRDTGGDKIIGSLRAICHLEDLQAKCLKRFGKPFRVIQPMNNTGVSASAGTHDFDFCFDGDIPGVSWADTNHFFRSNGVGGWVRTPSQGFSYHWHGFTLPPREGKSISDDFQVHGFKVGKYVDGGYSTTGRLITSSQIADYYNHAFGLSNHHTPNSDKAWYPSDIEATIFNLPRWIAAQKGGAPVPTKPPIKTPTNPPSPVAGTLRVDGVDISHHQGGAINWAAAKKAGVRWAYHKATEGSTYKDPNYTKRRAEAKKAGVPFGAYHFARPSTKDAAVEAKFFLATAKPMPGDLLPMLDIEVTDGMSVDAIQKWVSQFSAAVKASIGHKPIIYTQSSWDLGAANESSHIIWRARYNDDNRPPARKWDIHQFSNGVIGKPHSVAGFGNVDLNVMRKGLSVSEMTLPAKAAPTPAPTPAPAPAPTPEPTKPPVSGNPLEYAELFMGHLSLQFSDGPLQWRSDAEKVFGLGYDWVTGTEAGDDDDWPILLDAANRMGYKIARFRSNWVAVNKAIIRKGTWKVGSVITADNDLTVGRGHDTCIIGATFEHRNPGIGTVTVLCSHYPRFGRPDGNAEYSANLKYTTATGHEVGAMMERLGAGLDLCFYGGDQNIVDKNTDTFFGAPATSCWDDLKVYPNTGHGNIDVIARFNKDARVKIKGARAFDDKQSFFNTDHFLIQARYTVRLLDTTKEKKA